MISSELLKNLKVLYIESDPATSLIITKVLKESVGKFVVAISGEDGIKKFYEQHPDIIITELNLCGISGIDMIKELRKKGHNNPAAIVSVESSLVDLNTMLEVLDLKINKFFVKPVDCEQIKGFLKSTSNEIFNNKFGSTLSEWNICLSNEAKQKLELEIRNAYSKYLKIFTGKGAESIQVFLKCGEIEIISKGHLTNLEKTLIGFGGNEGIIELLRKTIYEKSRYNLEVLIEEVIGIKVKVRDVEVFVNDNREKITISLL